MRARFLGVLLLALGLAPPVAAQTETIEYYGTDAVGSVRIVFDASGAVLGRHDYDPFGREILAAWGASSERFGGQSTDDEAQQAYFHARQFQSRTGRFGTPDPVFAGSGDPQRLNRYSYGLGNPSRYVDVFGTDPSDPFNPCVDSSSPDCISDNPFWPGFGGGNDEICPLFHGGLCGEQPPKTPHPTKPTPPTPPVPPTDPPPSDPPPAPPTPPKPTWYDSFKNLFGRVFGDQLQNNTDRTLCVKPESGEVPVPLPPGQVYRGAFDGFSDPANPGMVYKVIDFMSAAVLSSGTVIPYPGPLTNVFGSVPPAGLAAYQHRKGGWKPRSAFDPTDGWDPLFASSFGGCS